MDHHVADSSSSHSRSLGSFRRSGSHPLRLRNSNHTYNEHADTHEDVPGCHDQSSDMPLAAEDEDDVFVLPKSGRTRISSSNSHAVRAMAEMKELQARMHRLESQLNLSLDSETSSKAIGVEPDQNSEETGISGHSTLTCSLEEDTSVASDIIPQVIERLWSDFMNKSAEDGIDFAIEVLKGDPSYYHPSKNTAKQGKAEIAVLKEAASVTEAVKRTLQIPDITGTAVEDQQCMPDRIRINSPYILSTLSGIDKHIDASGPMVMLRPYKFLVHHASRIEDAISLLRRRSEEENSNNGDIATIQTTLQHMQCLVDFYDRRIRPTVNTLRDSSTRKIAFRDLWYIFPPGENVFMPLRNLRGSVFRDAMDTTPDTFQRRYNMLWRIVGAGGGRPDLSASRNRELSIRSTPFKALAYYVDYDGKFFVPIIHEFTILPYSGERDITSLEWFPIRFLKDGSERLRDHTDQAMKTFAAIASGSTHCYYAGLTMATQPCGCSLQEAPLHQEWVESEVVIDFKATLRMHPSWRPKATPWSPPPRHEGEFHEQSVVRYWKDKERRHLEASEHEVTFNDYSIDKESSFIFKHQEPIFSPVPSGWASNTEMLPEKDVGLLCGRVFGFVLRTRSFAPLWRWSLQPIEKQSHSLENLQLRDDTFKDTIFALVESHFRQISHHSPDLEYDVVKGKGKGLIILLHGAPGVGKTSTAESVAAKSGRPLFQITCGDLGLTPGEVEKNLKEIFRFAQLWNCVLLLDECEIFLTQRTKNDIKRNALVSVFLRTLEFYTGVLFLTTNRVGVLDDAIKSRLTWTAYYPVLDEKQTMRIWRVNLKLLRGRNQSLEVDVKGILRFALDHFRTTSLTDSSWNGRQIQNAFKVATALAEWEFHNQDEQLKDDLGSLDDVKQTRPRLTADCFYVIAQGTQAFDDYLRKARGFTEKERAYDNMERDDEYDVDQAMMELEEEEQHRISRAPSVSPVQSHTRRSSAGMMSLHTAQQPASPHALSPIGRRYSTPKGAPSGFRSVSESSLMPTAHQQRTRRGTTPSTVLPVFAQDAKGHQPYLNGVHRQRRQDDYRNSIDQGLGHHSPRTRLNPDEMVEEQELFEDDTITSSSGLEGYGQES